ncbi:MAG TPA: immunoglobulin domain-containing protein [Verrucomicrobiae bacterium]|nr:immunoglobulin domain-containing protein [Verrucomicrobiae bacterium]
MGKYLVYALGLVLVAATQLRADVTVSDGNATTFTNALNTVIGAGGGTITVTTPILIGNTNGDFDEQSFDGESIVTVNGGNTNSIFIVTNNASLTLANMTVTGGRGQFGGAMNIAEGGGVTLMNCTFANNHVTGADGQNGESFSDSTRDVAVGKDGGRGTPGTPAYGGAIYNLGDLAIFECKFMTNGAVGGTGGDGGDGENAGTRGGKGGAGGAGGAVAGGAVFNMGTIIISNCTFSANTAAGGSGGIGGLGGSAIVGGVNGLAGMTGTASGGGLYTAAPLPPANSSLVLNSTFNNNTAQGGDGSTGGTSGSGAGQAGPRGGDALGGGIENSGSLLITNSTFYENTASGGGGGDGGVGGAKGGNGGVGGSAIGGGIYNSGTITVANCTFSKGSASGGDAGTAGSGASAGKNGKVGSSFGGNIANVAKKKHGSFNLVNSIVATALSGKAGYGTIIDGGYNLIADKSIKFKTKLHSQINTNALFGGGDIADNGGPTETIALPTNSIAIDRVPPELTLTNDQRGFLRPVGTNSDVGAYEADPRRATIFVQPLDNTNAIVGSNVTFFVSAGGESPLFYQWYFDGVAISNAINPSFTITNVQPANDGGYQVVVTNSFNSATSRVATLASQVISNTVPAIVVQPTNRQDVLVGTTVTISITATSAAPIFYQWYFEDSATLNVFLLTGATNNILTLANVQTTNTGLYQVIATNIVGAVTSTVSRLVVTNAASDTNFQTGFLRLRDISSHLTMASLSKFGEESTVFGSAISARDAEPTPRSRKLSAKAIAASSSPDPRRTVMFQPATLAFDRRWVYR